MSNVDGVRAAVLAFLETMPLDATCALLLKTDELAVLHMSLATLQEWYERSGAHVKDMEIFGRLQHKVETVLSQAGYGGDPR